MYIRIVNVLYYNYSKSRRKTNQMHLGILCTIKLSSNPSEIYYYCRSRKFYHGVNIQLTCKCLLFTMCYE